MPDAVAALPDLALAIVAGPVALLATLFVAFLADRRLTEAVVGRLVQATVV
ncbi:MAG: hypothetical protein JNL97_09780, partial [Verrucomicrobiales bacterium]|nr:hypothetical protein [Verrucomicrobiales bacterium]